MFSAEGDQITITMSRDDWNQLLVMLGAACAVAAEKPFFFDRVRLVNRLNEGNPDFIPYVIRANHDETH
jgi:hypothetical protein